MVNGIAYINFRLFTVTISGCNDIRSKYSWMILIVGCITYPVLGCCDCSISKDACSWLVNGNMGKIINQK